MSLVRHLVYFVWDELIFDTVKGAIFLSRDSRDLRLMYYRIFRNYMLCISLIYHLKFNVSEMHANEKH